MKIIQTIGRDTLGDNTPADNDRFIIAVTTTLAMHYPQAQITVKLGEHSSIHADQDTTGEVAERVQQISNTVWNNADY